MELIRQWSPLIIAALTLVSTVLLALLRSELRDACLQAKRDAVEEMTPRLVRLERSKLSRELYDQAMKDLLRRVAVVEEQQRKGSAE